MSSTLPYVLVCCGLYGFDYLRRIIKTRISRAFIRPLPELNSTRIEVPRINAGWHAGQHVRIRVMSAGMGWWGWTEVHPFTIASVARGQEGLVLLCKKSGSWTSKLYQMAKVGGYVEGGIGREVSVMIEGPYGDESSSS
jgi:predicted ferric reductase